MKTIHLGASWLDLGVQEQCNYKEYVIRVSFSPKGNKLVYGFAQIEASDNFIPRPTTPPTLQNWRGIIERDVFL
ncbi:hypothetical protein ACFQ3R_00110 [Mesonia ostreae]|uniref:Uncharacterized protein n=1 Tax=Mesonia ostreae TaxID=861110 RepID=A0ABU2KJK5_9FLAO|nr:hypothetical protein [Mesonia ostreae]MDT0294905.1 hypothetical protein [Mesonia ostreae]